MMVRRLLVMCVLNGSIDVEGGAGPIVSSGISGSELKKSIESDESVESVKSVVSCIC